MRHANGIRMSEFNAHITNLNIRAQYSNPNDSRKDKSDNLEMMLIEAQALVYRIEQDLEYLTNDKYHAVYTNKDYQTA